jgi:hypothetical protein
MTVAAYGLATPFMRGVLQPPHAPLDRIGGVTITGAWGISRPLLSSFGAADRLRVRDTSGTGTAFDDVPSAAAALEFLNGSAGAVVSLYDHSGNDRMLTNAAADQQPAFTDDVGSLFRSGATFDAVDDYLNGDVLSEFMTNAAGYVVCAGLFAALTANDASLFKNQPLWRVITTSCGTFAKSDGALYGYGFDSGPKYALGASIGEDTPFVHEWWHDSGTMYSRLNGGAVYQAALNAFPSVVMSRAFGLGRDNATAGAPGANATILEIATLSARPAQADALAADMMAFYGIE